MTVRFCDLEVVIVTPAEGAREELLALRVKILDEYTAAFGDRFEAELSEAENGDWVDVWRWVDRADADHALAHREHIPSFAVWESLVTLRSLTWAKILTAPGR